MRVEFNKATFETLLKALDYAIECADTNYAVEGLTMILVPGEEKLKVKADKEESEEDAA